MTKSPWFSSINSVESAQAEIQNIVVMLLFVIGLKMITGVMSASIISVVLEILILVAIAFGLKRFQSRIAAIALAIFSAFHVVGEWFLHVETGHNFSWILLFLLVWMSRRSIEATFKLNGQFKAVSNS